MILLSKTHIRSPEIAGESTNLQPEWPLQRKSPKNYYHPNREDDTSSYSEFDSSSDEDYDDSSNPDDHHSVEHTNTGTIKVDADTPPRDVTQDKKTGLASTASTRDAAYADLSDCSYNP